MAVESLVWSVNVEIWTDSHEWECYTAWRESQKCNNFWALLLVLLLENFIDFQLIHFSTANILKLIFTSALQTLETHIHFSTANIWNSCSLQHCKHLKLMFTSALQTFETHVHFSTANIRNSYSLQHCKHSKLIFTSALQTFETHVHFSIANIWNSCSLQHCKHLKLMFTSALQTFETHIHFSTANIWNSCSLQHCKHLKLIFTVNTAALNIIVTAVTSSYEHFLNVLGIIYLSCGILLPGKAKCNVQALFCCRGHVKS